MRIRSAGACALMLIGVVNLAAQSRITTNPADTHLKRMFPNAAGISPHAGTPLHWKIYGDPKKDPTPQPTAYAFWTTDVTPHERGYNGPTHMFVGMNTSGIIVGVVTDFSTDPYADFSVYPAEFGAQFKGKSIRAPFRVGDDIHAVSRATLTISSATRAVRDSARTMAKLFLNPADVERGAQRPDFARGVARHLRRPTLVRTEASFPSAAGDGSPRGDHPRAGQDNTAPAKRSRRVSRRFETELR